MMIKAALLLAVIGHILCGVCDCLLSYSPKGRLNLKDIRDPEKMRALFEGMPLSYPMASIVMGTFAILMFSFDYFALSFWMRQFSHRICCQPMEGISACIRHFPSGLE